jgi:hypothetical protein
MAEGNAITVKIGAETDGIEKGIRDIQNSLKNLDSGAQNASKGFDLSFGKIGIAAGVAGAAVKAGMMAVEAATAAARAVVDGFGDAIDLGGKLNDLSTATGDTAGNLLLMQRAFDNAGAGADKVGPAIAKMQKSIQDASEGSKEAVDSLAMMGLTAADLEGKLPSEQMAILAKGIQGIDDPTQRAAAAMGVFGRSGAQLLPLLINLDGELATASNQLGSLPGIMDRSNAAFDTLSDNLGVLGTKARDFAAGFIEEALPALNAFTTALTGVDAAGWGQKLMDQVMSVADFLLGAFKAPMPAIEAIGSALETGVKIAGNNYLNSLVNAGKFLSSFFSSDLPGIISGVLGNSLIKAFVDSAKAFIDAIRGVITAFETWLGNAITNVVDFFTTKFSAVLGAVAQDFQAAMSDPIGFVTGKLDSALGAVMANGGDTFQTSFDKAGGSALDKISAGLGAVSDEYGDKIVAGATRAKEEFGKLVDSIEPSARDFFGAEESAARTNAKFGEVVEAGKKLREDFEKSAPAAESAKQEVSAAAEEARDIAGSFGKSETSAKNIKAELSASAKLMESIAKAEQGNTKAGKLEAKTQQQLADGNTRGARATAERLAREERRQNLTGMGETLERQIRGNTDNLGYRGDEGRPVLGFKSAKDFAKGNAFQQLEDLGLERKLGETESQAEKRVDDYLGGLDRGTSSVDKPGQTGRTRDQAKSGSDKSSSKSPLETLVEDIKKLVEKIEPKLPVAALTA